MRRKNMVVRVCILAAAVIFVTMLGCFNDEPEQLTSPQIEQPALTSVGDEEAYANFRAFVSSGQNHQPDPNARTPRPPQVLHPRALAEEPPASITPPSLNLTLREGDCERVSKSVFLPGSTIRRADILFVLDLTGSMYEEIDQVKLDIQDIADSLAMLVEDPAFGVVSHMDYPDYYDFCGYDATYGSSGDYEYLLGQAINTDVNLTKNAVVALVMGSGWDGSESYARVFYETYSDPAIGWRPGARRIVVAFGDNVPHDCDLGSCLGLPLGSTGIDPGRDDTAGTADDIPLMPTLAAMNANGITLIEIFSGGAGTAFDLWQCWAAETANGGAFLINSDGTVPGGMNLARLILERITEVSTQCEVLELGITTGFEEWLQNVTPPEYFGVDLPATVTFDLDICVPAATAPGTYVFEICAKCDLSEEVCEVDTVTVVPPFTPYLDIHPRSCPNPLNLKGIGLTPAALLGTDDFDVTQVDPATLRLEGVPAVRWAFEDVATPLVDGEECECTTLGPDGYMDLTLKFDAQALVEALGTLSEGDVLVLTITGELKDGTPFEVADCVIIRGAKKMEGDIGG